MARHAVPQGNAEGALHCIHVAMDVDTLAVRAGNGKAVVAQCL